MQWSCGLLNRCKDRSPLEIDGTRLMEQLALRQSVAAPLSHQATATGRTDQRDSGTPQPGRDLIDQLAKQVRKIEVRGIERSSTKTTAELTSSTGCSAMDACLPHGGYVSGTVIEYLRATPACGATYLAFTAAFEACRLHGGYLVVVDNHDVREHLYPPALLAHGIDLQKVIFVRPQSATDAIWAVDQALRTPAVSAVVGELERFDDRAARRFQLAAESGGGNAFLLRSAVARQRPSWADVQWMVRPLSHANATQARLPKSLPKGSPLHNANAPTPQTTASFRGELPNSKIPTNHRSPLDNKATQTRGPSQTSDRQNNARHRQIELTLLRNRGGASGANLSIEIQAVTGKLAASPNTNLRTTPLQTERVAASKNPTRPMDEQAASMRLATQLARPTNPSRNASAG